MIIMTAVLRPAAGKSEELEAALATLIPETFKESGAVEYRLHKTRDNSGRYWFFERFANQAALDEHLAMPYVQSVFARFPELLEGPPEVEFHEFKGGFVRNFEG